MARFHKELYEWILCAQIQNHLRFTSKFVFTQPLRYEQDVSQCQLFKQSKAHLNLEFFLLYCLPKEFSLPY